MQIRALLWLACVGLAMGLSTAADACSPPAGASYSAELVSEVCAVPAAVPACAAVSDDIDPSAVVPDPPRAVAARTRVEGRRAIQSARFSSRPAIDFARPSLQLQHIRLQI